MENQLGGLIESARLEMKLSRESVAESLDVATTTVLRWEKGELMPSFPNVVKLSHLLKKPLTYFSEEKQDELSLDELTEMMTIIASLKGDDLDILRGTLKALSRPLPVKAQKKKEA